MAAECATMHRSSFSRNRSAELVHSLGPDVQPVKNQDNGACRPFLLDTNRSVTSGRHVFRLWFIPADAAEQDEQERDEDE
jgi:hypothetical protein